MNTSLTPTREKVLVLLIAAVQFINILDFMIVMPLGPDLAQHLDIAVAHLGWIGGSYTAAACVAGVLGSFLFDKAPRKTLLLTALIGLSLATAAGAYASDLTGLLGARIAAGLFGGPATSVAMAIISDVIPPARRGRAMGLVMGAFSIASIAGVPVALELARWGGWQAPFLAIGAAGLILSALCYLLLPTLASHLLPGSSEEPDTKNQGEPALLNPFFEPLYLKAFLAMGATIFGTFLLVPNVSSYVQFNLHWPREKLGSLYLVGGIASLIAMQLGGIWADKRGSFSPTLFSTVAFIITIFFGFVSLTTAMPVLFLFALFMATNSLRAVSLNTLTSKIPPPALRARFMSVQSAVQHLMSSAGAFLAALILKTGPGQSLVGMPKLGVLVMGVSLLCPVLALQIEKQLNR